MRADKVGRLVVEPAGELLVLPSPSWGPTAEVVEAARTKPAVARQGDKPAGEYFDRQVVAHRPKAESVAPD